MDGLDRSAQEQRALAIGHFEPEIRADHLGVLNPLSYTVRSRFAIIELIKHFSWDDGKDDDDPLNLVNLRQSLPSWTQARHREIHFYAWLQYLNL